MDRLLRRYARRKGETLRTTLDASDNTSGAATASAHLDADEMNAYAEGALPEASRSRYFAHLADCETCRKLVTELTLAASVSNEGKARVAALDIKPPTAWRKWLGAIFSPPVLRYGVPAMALFAVIIVVAIVAMRSKRDAGSIVQNRDEARSSAPAGAADSRLATQNTATTGTAESHSNSNAAPLADQQIPAQPGLAATPLPADNAPMNEAAPDVSQETVTESASTRSGDIKNKAGEFGVGRKSEQEEVAAAPPPPATKSPVLAAPAVIEDKRRDMQDAPKQSKAAGKDDAEGLAINGRTAGGARANNTQVDEDRNEVGRTATSATARPAQNQARRAPSAAAKSGPAESMTERERKESTGGTRNVGGRNFQRQGNAWVDTAYNSSRPTTNIKRGSEQYRALVADEPGLRAIATQLGGEVFVVWKSRAYRFY
jgi:hypothetical protein